MDGCTNWDCEKLNYDVAENIQDDIENEIHKRLGFCGCGAPEKCFILIKSILDLKIKARSDCKNDINTWYSDYDLSLKELLSKNVDALMWIVEYLLDDKHITSHGGNVSGSWLDDLEFKELLDVHCDNLKL